MTMKKKILVALLLTITISYSCVGCGQTQDPTESSQDEQSTTDESPNDEIVIDPNATISPYYKAPSEEDVNEDASDADDSIDSTANNSDGYINATVYNEANTDDFSDTQIEFYDPTTNEAVLERVNRNVYVATYGSDSNEGTEEAPFRTIQKALDVVSPGYTVYIKSGIYSGKNIFTNSGTEEAKITVAAMPLQDVVVTLGYGESGAIFDINGQSNICIRELRIGYSRSDWVYGVYMHGGEHNITVTDNDICNLATYNRSGYGYGGAYAVLMYGQGPDEETAIDNVSIDNNRIYTIETGNCEAVAASGNVSNIAINSNIIFDIMNIGIDIYGNADYCTNPALDQPRNVEINSNTVYNCVSDNYAVAGIYIDGARDTNISDNVIYENMYGVIVASEHRDDNYPVTNISVNNNKIHDNHDGGIAFGGYDTTLAGLVTDSEIIGNIMYHNGLIANDGWNGEISVEKCSNITISDNEIIAHDYKYPVISSQVSIDFVKNVTFTNNLYQTPYPENIRFRFAGEYYTGLDNWNKAMNASDISSKSATK